MVAGDSTAYAPSMHPTIRTIKTNKSSATVFPSCGLTMWTLQTFAWLLFLLGTATRPNHSNPPLEAAYVVQKAHALDDTNLPVVQKAQALSDNPHSVQKALSLNYTPTVAQRALALNDDTSYYYKSIYRDVYADSTTVADAVMVEISWWPPNNKNVELMSHDENHTSRQHDSETYESGLNGQHRVVRPYTSIEIKISASQHQRNRCVETQSHSPWTQIERRNDKSETGVSVYKHQRSHPLQIDVQRLPRCNKSEDEQQSERFISEPIHLERSETAVKTSSAYVNRRLGSPKLSTPMYQYQ